MKLIIDIPDTDIPKRQDILSVDLCFIDGQVGQCTYPFEVLQEEPKTGHCKDCKLWKDSDGVFRRGIGAESQCPMNRIEVFEGNGYCYMFEPQESEDKNNG